MATLLCILYLHMTNYKHISSLRGSNGFISKRKLFEITDSILTQLHLFDSPLYQSDYVNFLCCIESMYSQAGIHIGSPTFLFQRNLSLFRRRCAQKICKLLCYYPLQKGRSFYFFKESDEFLCSIQLTWQKEWNAPTRVFDIIGVTFLLTFLLTIRSEQVQFALKSEITASYLGGIAT